MPWTEHAHGPALDGPAGELHAAQAEAAALRSQVAELEADMDRLIAALCYAALHDGRGGRVGLPLLWRACLDAPPR